jgi:uncharacterized protein YjcR
MKAQERDRARALRQQGMSLREIVENLGVSKASVSVWVRNIELSDAQIRSAPLLAQTSEPLPGTADRGFPRSQSSLAGIVRTQAAFRNVQCVC